MKYNSYYSVLLSNHFSDSNLTIQQYRKLVGIGLKKLYNILELKIFITESEYNLYLKTFKRNFANFKQQINFKVKGQSKDFNLDKLVKEAYKQNIILKIKFND